MKKRFAAFIVAFSILTTALFDYTGAAASLYFIAVDNTLLKFRASAVPFIFNDILYVPSTTFTELGIYSIGSNELGMVYIYRGARYVYFYENENKSVDQDGREREGASARSKNGIFFLPLNVVCSYFDLQYDIIVLDSYSIIRFKTAEAANLINEKTFASIYKEQLQAYANEYYEGGETGSPPSGGYPTPPSVPSPAYNDVKVYLSFYNISAGYASEILSTLAGPGYRSCFFVNADEIRNNPGLIRRIYGSGHTLGIWLIEGTYEEYLEVSALLFEAAKVRTVLVSAGEAAEEALVMAEENSLVFLSASRDYGGQTNVSSETITNRIPTTPGAEYSIRLECSENINHALFGVLSFLRRNEYSVMKITETTVPTR